MKLISHNTLTVEFSNALPNKLNDLGIQIGSLFTKDQFDTIFSHFWLLQGYVTALKTPCSQVSRFQWRLEFAY